MALIRIQLGLTPATWDRVEKLRNQLSKLAPEDARSAVQTSGVINVLMEQGFKSVKLKTMLKRVLELDIGPGGRKRASA